MSAPRITLSVAFVITATMAACGGRTSDLGGGPGGGASSSSGGSGGTSSGSGSSGGSGSGGGSTSSGGSGGSGSGGGSSTGGSTSSSGGGGCPTQPGEGVCSPGEDCTYGSGCNAVDCSCDAKGGWICDSTSCPPPVCPPAASPGTECTLQGQSCDYASFGGGCGLTCFCESVQGGFLEWSCTAPPCPAPVCPPDEPKPGTACEPAGVGNVCFYPDDAGCGDECVCDPAGTWSCTIGLCIDAGAAGPDAGFDPG
jgi:hypothetical protein